MTIQLVKLALRENMMKKILVQDSITALDHQQILDLAKIYTSKKMWFSCTSMLKKRLKLENDNQYKTQYYNCLGFCYYCMTIYDSAKNYYIEAINSDSHFTLARTNLAQTYTKAGDNKNALATYESIISYDANNPVALKNIDRLKASI